MHNFINKIIGDYNAKEIKKIEPLIREINRLEESYQALSEEELKGHTRQFRERIQKGESLNSILPEAFATVKNACRRLVGKKFILGKEEQTWSIVPYDCQLIGGVILHRGRIAEMKTGEGKTLVATLPLYLNALTGKGAHLVTVNDYLAKRDAAWMGVIYQYLGLSVGVIVHGLSTEQRQEAYAADITYGTNNEFGFDYLRDNMATQLQHRVQRKLHYAIVDEVDSILIDEARTPLIISAQAEESTDKYRKYAHLIRQLKSDEDYVIDEKKRTATLTEAGIASMERLLGIENIYTEAGFIEVHHIEQSLKAEAIFKRDIDYVIKEDEILIVDEFTGRLMPGRRYSDGLHQAIEAKENVEVKRESRTLATITFQNYFRLFEKLAGMTGTAATEAEEFEKIYGLQTFVIPTAKSMIRADKGDVIYKTVKGKLLSVMNVIKEKHAKGQPVLVGTISVEKSEQLSQLLKLHGVPHNVLNAKNHEKEAEIVAQAGQKGAVTIATNMAGRGTDIKLGPDVVELGGLAILGTERHESRRIDNQLRGRSGRQGDPGESQFFVSMEDDLMRLFGADRIKSMMDRLGLLEDMPIENRMISRSIESAQKRVEGHHFDIRKHLLEYDDVMNKHRQIIYVRRLKALEQESLREDIVGMMRAEAKALAQEYTENVDALEWNFKTMAEAINAFLTHPVAEIAALEKCATPQQIENYMFNAFSSEYEKKEQGLPDPTLWRQVEKGVSLRVIDTLWMEHIDLMTHLRESVSLSGYGQRDPLIEYKREAFAYFQQLLANIQHNTLATLLKLQVNIELPQEAIPAPEPDLLHLQTNEDQIEQAVTTSSLKQSATASPETAVAQRISAEIKKTPPKGAPSGPLAAALGTERNEPCPCKSGKKYKKCCGK
ncbi:preprotein translocase subunit SecA [Candidatus Peregrinibacteria bacterium]|nr:preprotein translocase subunit SecA [Candidatus Peregrinibacteria bacterium]